MYTRTEEEKVAVLRHMLIISNQVVTREISWVAMNYGIHPATLRKLARTVKQEMARISH